MPHWLRMSNVALLAGLVAGCGSSGVYWVDSKLAKLSNPNAGGGSSVVDAPWNAIRESSPKPNAVAAVRQAKPVRTTEEPDRIVPEKVAEPSLAKFDYGEPSHPKPLAKRDGPLPAAFALATPIRDSREGEPAVREVAWNKKPESVELTQVSETDEGRKSPIGPFSPRPEYVEANDDAKTTSAEQAVKAETPSTERRVEPAVPAASPIPKAAPTPPPKLELANVTLCREIKGFGSTVPMEGALRPGKQAVVYMEVSGQTAKPAIGGVEARFRPKLRLTPKAGGATTEWKFGDIVDTAPARRTQFFCHLVLKLPESASEGEYRLEVSLDDVHGGSTAIGETSLRVESATAQGK
jgi:hypothetical protein